MGFLQGIVSMDKGKGWDLTSLHSLQGGAEWIRKNAGAQVVLVVRPGDVAFAVDPMIAPADARLLVENELESMQRQLSEMRLEARAKAKAKAKDMGAMR